MASWDQLLGLMAPQSGPAPTAEQRAAYEAMARAQQAKAGPMSRMVTGAMEALPQIAKGAIVDDPMMPQAELQSKGGWEKLGMLMGAGFVPPSARRLQSLKVLEDIRTLPSLTGWTPEAVSELTQLQSKFPRVFSHVEEFSPIKNTVTKLRGMWGKLGGVNYAGKGKGKSRIELNTNVDPGTFAESAAHELAHAAQRIRDPRMGSKYEEAHKALGYLNNPYEKNANKAGANYVRRTNKK